ncbi:uncharacterized protein LOC34621112 [Cyclospora cayetanensis]|uniref:Uncharacterized protein LOC34621112 n=1 Tax=Cyclospora cayetanensis TaxID=88456 RepID=A0A6P6RWP1_9EIME|nr:uncharacterized protein LOC34621112 [Cyclospora cayetanensis]
MVRFERAEGAILGSVEPTQSTLRHADVSSGYEQESDDLPPKVVRAKCRPRRYRGVFLSCTPPSTDGQPTASSEVAAAASASGEPECKMESGHFDSTAFFTMLALAVHGLFEGVIVGAARDLSMMWMMSAVVIGHKWAEAMLLMCRLLERKTCVMATALLIVTFACSSPLGVLVGAILATEGKLASGICNALGAGTVFYIASEISGSAFQGCRKTRFFQFLTYCSGAVLVMALTLLDVAYGQ